MNILVTGANGLVGSHLLRRLDGIHTVMGISRHEPKISGFKSTSYTNLDITSSSKLNSFLTQSEYEIIINCAAMADVDRCEREREDAAAINFEAVTTLTEYCENTGALLLHISTDYIFKGDSGPYNENDAPHPINFYGRTKLAAERIIQDSECEYIIVRTVHVYGNLPESPSKQIAWLLAAHETGGKIIGAVDQFSNPTWAGNLADSIVELMVSDYRGTIHIGGPDYVSRYEFALEGAKILGIDSDIIKEAKIAELDLSAPRPLKAGLKIEKMKKLLKTSPIGIKEGLIKVKSGAK